MQKVYVKFQKSGLGNLMLVWSKAKLFAELNHLPVISSPWWGLRWGTWFRNERRKRHYIGYFKENTFKEWLNIKLSSFVTTIIKDPEIKKLDEDQKKDNQLFVFSKISNGNDIFFEIREHRDYIKRELFNLIRPGLLQKLEWYIKPVIAIHIRRGDFKIANPLTPLSFFLDCITSIRSVTGENWPVTIFTDAHPGEIDEILRLPDTFLAEEKPDILDILLMSQSKVIVLSQSSTFSYWGAFLSDAVVLKPFDDWQKQIRNNDINRQFPEIAWRENDPACVQQLKVALR